MVGAGAAESRMWRMTGECFERTRRARLFVMGVSGGRYRGDSEECVVSIVCLLSLLMYSMVRGLIVGGSGGRSQCRYGSLGRECEHMR